MKQTMIIEGLQIDLSRRVPIKGTGIGFTTERSGTRTGSVTVTIDTEKLAYLAERALRSKSGKATACFGGLVLKVKDSADHPLV